MEFVLIGTHIVAMIAGGLIAYRATKRSDKAKAFAEMADRKISDL